MDPSVHAAKRAGPGRPEAPPAQRAEPHAAGVSDPLRTPEVMRTDFVNTISHELRTPLTSILAYAEFLEDGLAGVLSPLQREYVGHIQASSARLRSLVDDLVEFACSDGGAMRLVFREVDMAQTISAIAEALRPQLEARHLSLALELPDEPVRLVMDPRRIGQVLHNLVGNAIKFTPERGHVAVRLHRTPDGIRTEVVDTGIGIAARDMPRLFDRFFQADMSTTRACGGAGLGLYIARAIVEAHAGALGCESQPGQGSRFWFSLPADPFPLLEGTLPAL